MSADPWVTATTAGAARAARWLGERIPPNLSVFVAAIYLSNCVNLFTTLYGGDEPPRRAGALGVSTVASLLAAGFWTAFVAKIEIIDRAVDSAAVDGSGRREVRDQLWADVWLRVAAYLSAAMSSSVIALLVLVVPVRG